MFVQNHTGSVSSFLQKFTEKYRYGFNGQEKDDEINGAGNAYTATFWEYDARLGRRWNLDPKSTVGISDYACFGDNPILFKDPFGDIFDVTNEKGQNDVKGLTKSDNKQYVKFDKVGDKFRTKLDFGNLSQDEITQKLSEDKGLSLINDLVNAKETSINENGESTIKDISFIYDVSYIDKFKSRDGSLVSRPLNIFRNDGNSNALDAATNYSVTPRNINGGIGPEGNTPGFEGYEGQVTIAPGVFFNKDSYLVISRSSIVYHE